MLSNFNMSFIKITQCFHFKLHKIRKNEYVYRTRLNSFWLHSIFYKHMNSSVKAFDKHNLCLKIHKSLYVLKNLVKLFMCL